MAIVPVQPSSYNLEETVSIISSFYNFLVRMHAGESIEWVEYPPPGGWPTIPYEEYRKMGYNDTVIALIRQLPYFGNAESGCEIMEHTWLHNWKSELHSWDHELEKREAPDAPGSPLICLTKCEEYGFNVYCDTSRGAIVWTKEDGDFPDTALFGDLVYNDYHDEGQDLSQWFNAQWRDVRVFRIKTFFDMCMEQFSILTWIPSMEEGSEGQVTMISRSEEVDGLEALRIEILKEAGWPGTSWDKKKAVEETTERMREYMA
ncbi:hypothetical protein GQ53DRAFT_745365 [Thozetella sp. PMI_491]|nr:hypothetical protein GQ53DRAFT_745365 [Thozetella sp. PMI_491]